MPRSAAVAVNGLRSWRMSERGQSTRSALVPRCAAAGAGTGCRLSEETAIAPDSATLRISAHSAKVFSRAT